MAGIAEFTMAWEGSFKADFEGPYHCGITTGNDIKKYYVAIKSNDLDAATGFVINNAAINAYFDNLSNAPIKDSCELMCQHAAEFFVKEFAKDNRCPTCVYIKIYGLGNSYADYTWYPPKEEVPTA